jgi:hypothetical protein
MYDWNDVAARTEAVYERIMSTHTHTATMQERLLEYAALVWQPPTHLPCASCWRVFAPPAALFFSGVTVAESAWLRLVESLMPDEEVQRAIDFPSPPFAPPA